MNLTKNRIKSMNRLQINSQNSRKKVLLLVYLGRNNKSRNFKHQLQQKKNLKRKKKPFQKEKLEI
jgi:hypothetical protein